ncbi:reticulon-4-interacting protein 1 homolog, mitochondrial-like isoform X2 [Plectropomus leopardus]|uniref:reticulon-4-interacting protein 1 homolog, mitochondrial-like isoform X2 n=1 Tax=Plectropomus leopardus TaxID=160734 RepID=UPI001C4CD54A|nr:reticulon-4-interacting protein 1 homolog, mitochondrial-like isoform X2 [Plectropomus leopardus]
MCSVGAMASTRLLRLFNAKAANSSKTLARAGWSVCFRRNVCSSPSRLQSCMSAWVIDHYGTNEVLKYTEEIPIPTVNSPSEVMIKVHAASLNPLDVSMRGGYGAKLLKLRRDPLSVMGTDNDSEFPVILGRDVAGVVVDCGSEVTHVVPGDEVWAAVPPWKQGSLAEYVTLTEYEVSHKPKLLSHTEAASIPYVANTALSALVNAGGLCRDSSSDKRFDVILDSVGGETEEWAMSLLKPWAGAKYVTLVTPLLLNTDSMGLLDGTFHAGFTLHSKALQNIISSGVFYRWGFYAPDGPALDEVSRLVDAGKILPVVEAQFPFTQVPQAFQKLEQGHARGKTVVRVTEEDDRQAEELVQNSRTETAESEQEVRETAKQN